MKAGVSRAISLSFIMVLLSTVIALGDAPPPTDDLDPATWGTTMRNEAIDGTDWGKQIEDKLAEYNHPDRPGASVAILHNGKIVFAEGLGLADLEAKTPARADTNYRLASVTKQFTAMCIVMLSERGRLSLDDPITRYLPELPAVAKGISIRQLLGHTSGVVDYESLIPDRQQEQLKDRDVLELLTKQQGTYFTPGTQYRYSNSGYALLALIVERASGKGFADFLRQNIFEPLGMNDTVAFEKGVSTVPRRAMGYRQEGDSFVGSDQSLTSAVLGDGGIYTSVLDYAKWDEALYGTRLASQEALKEVFTPGKLPDGTSTGYGSGWRIDERHGWRVVSHNGETCGFNTAVRRVPSEHLTIVLLTNRAGEQAGHRADVLLEYALGGLSVVNDLESDLKKEPHKPEWEWRDARRLQVEGKGWVSTAQFYQRLPRKAEGVVPPMVWSLSKNTAGICVRFVTNSTRIAATWDGGGAMNHMAATGNSGLDLYRRQGSEWVFCGVGRPLTTRTTATLAHDLPAEPTEYLLYLPLYHDVTELRVGVEAGATLEPAAPRTTKPIVFYGTSITQGGCASRAGMCHPAILGRHLDREVINLGFSGSGKMEPQMAELVGELDPALFVLECLPNMTTEMVGERVAPFVEHLREVHPETQILLVENPINPTHNPGNAVLRKVFDGLVASGIKNLHYLAGEKLLAGVENGTVDGVHPTDLGFSRMAAAYEPVLRGILIAKEPVGPAIQ